MAVVRIFLRLNSTKTFVVDVKNFEAKSKLWVSPKPVTNPQFKNSKLALVNLKVSTTLLRLEINSFKRPIRRSRRPILSFKNIPRTWNVSRTFRPRTQEVFRSSRRTPSGTWRSDRCC